MKKLTNKINMAIIGLMAMAPVFPANAEGGGADMGNTVCELIKQFGGVFKTLRTLAFVGAAFYIASWAWEWISKGEVKKDEIQNKGIGLLVGFFVLFALGAILSAFLAMGNAENGACVAEAFK